MRSIPYHFLHPFCCNKSQSERDSPENGCGFGSHGDFVQKYCLNTGNEEFEINVSNVIYPNK